MKNSAVLPVHSDELSGESEATFGGDPRCLVVQRIIASTSFARSALLTNFLLYVCDRALRGRVGEITEHQIGVQALGRSEDYDPGIDNIVRTYARMLRKRLDEYFEGEGRDEPWRVSIPRGHYVPVFHLNGGSGAHASTPVDIPDSPRVPTEEDPSPISPRLRIPIRGIHDVPSEKLCWVLQRRWP